MVNKKKKRSKKQKQKQKKEIKYKTIQVRTEEINTLRTKILSIGFPISCKGITELFEHFDNYVRDGTQWSGKIPLRGFQRVCEVRLTNKENFKNIITLKYDSSI